MELFIMKRVILKTLTPLSAAVAVLAMASSGVQAQTTPVFEYNFPTSWGGTGTTVTDVSAGGHNAGIYSTLSLSAAVPSGAAPGSQSVNTSAGAFRTTANGLLDNSIVAAAGGFTYDVSFMWDGTDKTANGHVQKIIDYAGTESLQLTTTAGSADLQMGTSLDTGGLVIAAHMTISPNTWYHVTATFDSQGNSVVAGDLDGLVSLYVDGNLVDSGNATKGNQGDGLVRPIGVGQLGANFGYLVGFTGDIYDPTVSLGVAPVPEPSTIALGMMGGLAFVGTAVRRRFKK
jgi:hypothetical protein